MNWITGPNRAFGIGETKSQNAVIKVYSASELKNALSRIYSQSIGIGTIRICGDIIISEPIKLRQTLPPDTLPNEIIIESVGGAKIINGRTKTSDYTVADNIVFDMGYANNSPFNICKYTFRNLSINSYNALAFRALCQWDGTLGANCGPVLIENMIATNLLNIFDSRNGNIDLYNAIIHNLIFDTTDTIVAYSNCNINSTTTRISSGNFSDFSLSNLDLSYCTITFNDNSMCRSNIFTNIFIPYNIVSTDGTHGTGTLTGSGIFGGGYPKVAGWQINNDGTNNYTQFSGKIDVVGTDQGSNIATVEHFKLFNTSVVASGAVNIDTPTSPTNGRYNIEWNFTINIGGLVNNYCINTGFKVSGGTVTILSNSTIYAVEQYFTVTGLIPTAVGSVVRISPTDATNAITVDGSYRITGYKQFF